MGRTHAKKRHVCATRHFIPARKSYLTPSPTFRRSKEAKVIWV
jgi:hypothetical protein